MDADLDDQFLRFPRAAQSCTALGHATVCGISGITIQSTLTTIRPSGVVASLQSRHSTHKRLAIISGFPALPAVYPKAPEAGNILWENLELTMRQRRRRKTLTLWVTIALLGISFVILYGSNIAEKNYNSTGEILRTNGFWGSK